jgi:hypothetical protein
MGAFILGVVSLCAWRRITGRPVWYAYSFTPRRYHAAGPQWQRQRDGSTGGERKSSEKPAMFEAWTVRRTADVLKWAESVVRASVSLFCCFLLGWLRLPPRVRRSVAVIILYSRLLRRFSWG